MVIDTTERAPTDVAPQVERGASEEVRALLSVCLEILKELRALRHECVQVTAGPTRPVAHKPQVTQLL